MFPKSETEQPIIKSGACNIDGNLSKVGANCEEERQPILWTIQLIKFKELALCDKLPVSQSHQNTVF